VNQFFFYDMGSIKVVVVT